MTTPKIIELPSEPSSSSSKIRKIDVSSISKTKAKKTNSKIQKDTTSSPSWPRFIFKWSLFTILIAFGSAQFIAGDLLWGYRGKYTRLQTYTPAPKRVFSVEELKQYDGTDPEKPIYLAILGNVYDVTPGKLIYGPRGSYHFFSGRDASRAFVTGCFQTHLTHDLRGLSAFDIEQIESWKTFFDDHGRYKWIGKVNLPRIDPKTPIPVSCKEDPKDKPST